MAMQTMTAPAPFDPFAGARRGFAAIKSGLTDWLPARSRVRTDRRLRTGLARRDPATGLVDRKVATLWLHAAVGLALRGERPMALAVLTVEGDPAQARRAARRLMALAPAGDMLAALGDVTFVLGMHGLDEATARLRLGDMLAALAAEGIPLRGGVAMPGRDGQDVRPLLAAAERAAGRAVAA